MQFTLYLIPLFITIILGLTLAIYSWQNRQSPASISFMALCVAIVFWAAFYSLDVLSTSLETKHVVIPFTFIGVALVPPAWMVFSLYFAGRLNWITRRRLFLLLIVPVTTIVLIWTNPLHELVFINSRLEVINGLMLETADYGPWFWVHAGYSYLMLGIGTVILIRRVWVGRAAYRWQALFIMIGAVIPWFVNVVRVFKLIPMPVDFTSVSFTVALVAFGWSIFRFKLFKLIPIAHEKIFERMPDGVVVMDIHNVIVDVNPAAAQLIGNSADHIIGQNVLDVFVGQRDFVEKFIEINDGRTEVKFESPEGKFLWFDIQIAPLYGKQGALEGRLGIMREVTDRKQSELAAAMARDEALRANQFKTQLVSKVSHDLRTPLNAIGGYAELLTMEAYGELTQAQHGVLDRIQESTRYLNKLITDLLDQAQLAAGKLTLNEHSFVLRDLVENTAVSVRILAEMKGLTLSTTVDESLPPTLYGDSDRLQQVLLNLIGNAIKFTPRGEVSVSLKRMGDAQWSMSVSDTGTGIAPEAQIRIFEPFQQTEKTSGGHEGYGLGLAIVKELTTMMNGEIHVTSELDQGSTFTVILPLMEQVEMTA